MSKQNELVELARTGASGGGSKNMVINGDMRIDQRNSGSALSAHNANLFPVDRFRCLENTDGSFSMQRVADAPTGFEYSLKFTVTGTDTSLTTNQFTRALHPIEGHNTSHLNWGTSNAKTCTLSFYVKSSVAGQYYINIFNNSATRAMVKGYTIDAANTWEKKEITIIGDQTGTWETNNLAGIYIGWSQGSGPTYHTTTLDAYQSAFVMVKSDQTNLTATNGATWQLTGVQFELGEKATDFEHKSYAEELAKAQRYYYKLPIASYGPYLCQYTSGNRFSHFWHPVPMRATPTSTTTLSSGTAAEFSPDVHHTKYYNSASYSNTSTFSHTAYQADAEL